MSERWPSEPVPDADSLYRSVHRQWFSKKTGRVSPTYFRNATAPVTGRPGMSTDWSRYSTPAATRQRAREPEINGVIEFVVAEVRAIPGQIVEHTPIQDHPDPRVKDNRAHTDVFGPKEEDPEIQRQFARTCRILIALPE